MTRRARGGGCRGGAWDAELQSTARRRPRPCHRRQRVGSAASLPPMTTALCWLQTTTARPPSLRLPRSAGCRRPLDAPWQVGPNRCCRQAPGAQSPRAPSWSDADAGARCRKAPGARSPPVGRAAGRRRPMHSTTRSPGFWHQS